MKAPTITALAINALAINALAIKALTINALAMNALAMKRLAAVITLGLTAALAGCVPPSGNYSEFAVRGKGAPAPANGQVVYAEGVYQGELQGGYPHGKGSFAYRDGRRYEGGFAGGRAEGRGRMTYPDGRVVTGEYRQGLERNVEIVYSDGRRFTGVVQRGRAAGAGILALPSGGQLVGRFRNDRADGFGQLTGADGVPVYTGGFREGRPHGDGWCGAGSAAEPCIRDQGRDVTDATLRERAQQAVLRQIEDEAAREQAALRQEMTPRLAEGKARLATAEQTLEGWRGPQSGDPCYCSLGNLCLTVSNHNETAESRRLGEIAAERRRVECRARYRAYLDNSSQADYRGRLAQLDAEAGRVRAHYAQLRAEDKRRQDAIEAARQQRLRDQAQQQRLVQARVAQQQRERAAQRDKLRQQCADTTVARGRPCLCGALLNTPPVKGKGGACEA